jgi:hypothetical protein
VQSQAVPQGTPQVARHHTPLALHNCQPLLPLQEERRSRQRALHSLLVCYSHLVLLLVLRRTAAAAGHRGEAGCLEVLAGRGSHLVLAAAAALPAPSPSCEAVSRKVTQL